MPLPDEIRTLADQILAQLNEAQDFYLHTRQAWRLVQQTAREGRPVGILDNTSGMELPAKNLNSLAQRYVTVHLAESVFKSLSGLLEDWILGLARLWLTAYPKQLGAASGEFADRTRAQRREEILVPLSEILDAPDIAAILGDVAERVVRDLAYRRPDQWFQFLDNRVNLGCPDEAQRAALCEIKAVRDVLEHSRGVVGQDYINKARAAARYSVGEIVQIEEPYLIDCFALLRTVITSMADAAIRRSSGSPTG
jgi:hypothetical protein